MQKSDDWRSREQADPVARMPAEPFDAYSRYYDLFYRDKDYEAEVDYVDQLLRRYGSKGRDVLEFGSGTGRHGTLLAARGYRVTGIELSAEMVARAPTVPGFQSRRGDIHTVRLDRKFDAVLSLFHVMSYQTTNEDVAAVFARAADHLAAGGLFAFDVWYTPAVYTQRPQVRAKRLVEGDLRFTRIAEPTVHPNENRVDVHYTVIAHDLSAGSCQQFSEVHPMRHFSIPELDLFAAGAGFERVCAEGFLSGARADETTWGLCVVLRRR